jgi:hypothetical protein
MTGGRGLCRPLMTEQAYGYGHGGIYGYSLSSLKRRNHAHGKIGLPPTKREINALDILERIAGTPGAGALQMSRAHDFFAAPEEHGVAVERNSPEEITTRIYKNEVPAFIDQELECLYENLYSTVVEFTSRPPEPSAKIDTFVERQGGKLRTILLLQRHRKMVKVLNEVLEVDEQVMRRLAGFLFAEFPSVSVISFHAIRTNVANIGFPFQRFNILEDIVLALPPCRDEYLASLGKSTRKTIRYYTNRLMRCFPSFRYQIYSKHQISREHILAIITMKSARMAEKDKIAIDREEDVDVIWGLARRYGVVGIATINGEICAGWIGYRVGRHDYMSVSAYDGKYDDYRLGTLCCYFAICDCIVRGGLECHFLWGDDDYKFRFLGVRRELDDVVIYRSRAAMLASGGTVFRAVRKSTIRKVKRWLSRTGNKPEAAIVDAPAPGS